MFYVPIWLLISSLKKIVLFMVNKVVETSGVTFSKWDAIALFYIDLKPFYVLLEGCNIFCT